MKKLIILLAIAGTAKSATAQLSISPEIGYQMSKVRYQFFGEDENGDFKTGIRAGANIAIGVSNHLELRGGAFYSGKGGKVDLVGSETSRAFNYIDIPVFVNYMTGVPRGNRFFVGVGPYWAYAMGGSQKTAGIKSDVEIGSNAVSDDLKPMDFGLNANIGFMLSGGIYIRGIYAHGLTNVLPGGNGDNSMRNTSLSLSLGYNYTF